MKTPCAKVLVGAVLLTVFLLGTAYWLGPTAQCLDIQFTNKPIIFREFCRTILGFYGLLAALLVIVMILIPSLKSVCPACVLTKKHTINAIRKRSFFWVGLYLVYPFCTVGSVCFLI